MRKMELSRELQDEADRIAAMPDDTIDTADIPEVPAQAWRDAVRPALYRPRKQPVTLRLDADILAWFKDHAAGRGYQTEINRVLRRHVAKTEASSVS